MTPDEFLILAKELNAGSVQSPAGESKIRTAINRAYFFILIKIQSSLQAFGAHFVEGRDTHDQVIQCLFRDRSTTEIAKRLASLRKKRNDADYKLRLVGYGFGSDKALLAISEAERLSTEYDSLDKGPIVQAIKKVSP